MASGARDYYTSWGNALLSVLDGLDGKIDNVLTLGDLNSEQCDILTKLTGMDINLATGGDVVAALDSLDGKADGFITLADLNDDTCLMLAKLLGIETSVETGGDLIAALDALDGTMDGRLTLTELNSSSVKTNLDDAVTHLAAIIQDLADALVQQGGIHDDTTSMIDYSQEDTSGVIGLGWTLISSIHATRNMLVVQNIGVQPATISRDGGTTTDGDIAGNSEATFYDAPGLWLKTYVSSQNYTAHEEWAT